MDLTYGTLNHTREQVENTEGVMNSIVESVSRAGNAHESISKAVDQGVDQVDKTVQEMQVSRSYYDTVIKNIERLNTQVTKKGFLYEDINNMMEKTDELIIKIQQQ